MILDRVSVDRVPSLIALRSPKASAVRVELRKVAVWRRKKVDSRVRFPLYRQSLSARMSERKVLNKYFPPDFDPAKIPRRKMGKDKQQVVRLMAPFSMRCVYVCRPPLLLLRLSLPRFVQHLRRIHLQRQEVQREVITPSQPSRTPIHTAPRSSRKETVDGEDYYGIKVT